MGKLDTAVQEKIDNDADFQATLEGLNDEDRAAKIAEKSAEVREALFEETAAEKAKHEQAFKDQQARAEKAESQLKNNKPTPPKPVENNEDDEPKFSLADSYALQHAGVHPDDVGEVVKASKLLGKNIAETLKDPLVKARLGQLSEERKTAEAANTGAGKPTPAKKLTDAEIIEKANKGEIPEPGSPEAERLFHARRARK